MRRREFITLLGGAAAALPLAARAQQPAMPVIGCLFSQSPEMFATRMAAFRKGLSEAGYVEGRNVAFEYLWADQFNRLPEFAADLVRRRVAVIVTPGSIPAARAAKAATTTIPIVFTMSGDPVQFDLVASLNRPGGNVTGITSLARELGAKRFGLLHDLMPAGARFAVLTQSPAGVGPSAPMRDVQEAASSVGRQIDFFYARTNREVETAFTSLVQKRADALIVFNSVFLGSALVQLVNLAAHHRIPTIFWLRDFVEAGGLMSYGASLADQYRQAGIYTGRILKGDKPADLPVQQPSRFEFVINLQTAKTLGLTIPPGLLAIADEVIE